MHNKKKLLMGDVIVRDSAQQGRIGRATEGFKGPLTEPEAGGSRRTTLGARNGLQWAAHLDLVHILLADGLDQLRHSKRVVSCTHEPPLFRNEAPAKSAAVLPPAWPAATDAPLSGAMRREQRHAEPGRAPL